MSIRSYKDYFHAVAVRHKVLLHNPASDAPDGPIGGKRFTLFAQEDVINGLRTEIPDTAVMHLHLYDKHMQDNEAGDKRGNYNAGFMITQAAPLNDMDAQVEAWATCETIAEDIIDCLMYDERVLGICSFPLGIIDWNSLDVTNVGPLWNGRYGCFATFKYQERRASWITEDRINEAFNPAAGSQIFESQFESSFE